MILGTKSLFLTIAMKNCLQENTMYFFIPVNLRNLKKNKTLDIIIFNTGKGTRK